MSVSPRPADSGQTRSDGLDRARQGSYGVIRGQMESNRVGQGHMGQTRSDGLDRVKQEQTGSGRNEGSVLVTNLTGLMNQTRR